MQNGNDCDIEECKYTNENILSILELLINFEKYGKQLNYFSFYSKFQNLLITFEEWKYSNENPYTN